MDERPSVPWAPERTLRGLLVWTALTTVVFWLPTVRAPFDGPSYAWGLAGFGGRGLTRDYWLPLVGSVLAIAVQVLGWRGARPPFHVFLAAWHLLLVAAVAHAAITDPEGFRLQGDTLGLDISLAWIGLPLFGVPAALACGWAWRDLRRRSRPPAPAWTPRNTRWLAALFLTLPLQFALLRSGPPGSAADKAGVLLTVAQWLLLGRALRP